MKCQLCGKEDTILVDGPAGKSYCMDCFLTIEDNTVDVLAEPEVNLITMDDLLAAQEAHRPAPIESKRIRAKLKPGGNGEISRVKDSDKGDE